MTRVEAAPQFIAFLLDGSLSDSARPPVMGLVLATLTSFLGALYWRRRSIGRLVANWRGAFVSDEVAGSAGLVCGLRQNLRDLEVSYRVLYVRRSDVWIETSGRQDTREQGVLARWDSQEAFERAVRPARSDSPLPRVVAVRCSVGLRDRAPIEVRQLTELCTPDRAYLGQLEVAQLEPGSRLSLDVRIQWTSRRIDTWLRILDAYPVPTLPPGTTPVALRGSVFEGVAVPVPSSEEQVEQYLELARRTTEGVHTAPTDHGAFVHLLATGMGTTVVKVALRADVVRALADGALSAE